MKLDSLCTQTGRLSIEIAEKTRASNWEYRPSGIYRQDNSIFYVQGNRIVFYVFRKEHLVELHQQRYAGTEIEKRGTIRTFYIPLAVAGREAIHVVKCTMLSDGVNVEASSPIYDGL